MAHTTSGQLARKPPSIPRKGANDTATHSPVPVITPTIRYVASSLVASCCVSSRLVASRLAASRRIASLLALSCLVLSCPHISFLATELSPIPSSRRAFGTDISYGRFTANVTEFITQSITVFLSAV